MKQCPKCGRSYTDESQNFCLDDGAWLLDADPQTAILPPNSAEADTKLFGSVLPDPTISMSGYKPNSIAVLPFAHLSKDADDEYFCDGLAEELINALSRVDDLKVVARTSAFSFKGKNVDVAQVGSALNVNNVVEGSVRKFGNRMRISVSLTSTTDGFNIWSDKYDTEMRDLFDVQDEITFSVVKALKTKLLGKTDKPSDEMTALIDELKQHANDIDAYQLYLRGRHSVNTFTPDGFYKAAEFLNQAIAIDPGFAAAYAALADVHVLLTEFGDVPSLEGLPKAKEAALKSIDLDPSLSEARTSLALVLQEYDFDFAGAEREYIQAIELNPNNAMAHQYYGALLVQMGRSSEADLMCRKAIELDPLSAVGTWVYAFALFLSRRYTESIDETNRLLGIDPNFSAAFISLAFSSQMISDHSASTEAYARFLELCGLPELAAAGRHAFGDGGWEAFLRAMTSEEVSSQLSSYIVAVYHVALGEHDAAFVSLERSLARREGFIVMLKMDPRFDTLRDDPRFQELIRKVGFPVQNSPYETMP